MRIQVSELCRKAVGGGEPHMVTRETGRLLREEVGGLLSRMPAGGIMTLDFIDAGVIDFSCADEFLAKLLTRLTAGEYGEKYLLLSGLGDSHEENISVALERKKLTAMKVGSPSGWKCLGAIKPYLRQTLDLVMDRDILSARELSGILSLELNTSSTRLINLYRQRLVTRQERLIAEGGREFVYVGLAGANQGI